jgi:uncharacterized protein YecE (DUF72 family)
MATEIIVGICGFARSQAHVFAQLRLLEVQTTFYRPVKRATAEAWAVTNEIREALDAKVVVFQTPPRFAETAENIRNLRQFFRTIAPERRGISMVGEARGGWDRRTLAKLCEELDLVHGVDPFAAEPVTSGVAYFRLHGKPPTGEPNVPVHLYGRRLAAAI